MKKIILISFFTANALFAVTSQSIGKPTPPINNIQQPSVVTQPQQAKDFNQKPQQTVVPQTRTFNAPAISSESPSKLSQKSFDSVVEMLKTKESTKAQREYEDKKEKENREKAEAEEEKRLKKSELSEMLLPIPLRSISFGDKVIVYAEYREKKLSDNAKIQEVKDTKNQQDSQIQQTQDENKLDAVYDKKTVELNIGDVFGDWKVKTLTLTYVEYENKKNDNKIIKKYY